MARPLRIQFPGAYYHVMNRGLGGRKIFYNNQQRADFLQWVARAHELFQIEIHAYCLMDNHYHLLVKTPLANLSRAMHHIDACYAQSFNRSMETDGPLFRGRYKAIIVDYDEYYLHVGRYIHLNPVEAGLSLRPQDYFWSSCHYFFRGDHKPGWLVTEETLSHFNVRGSMKSYEYFLSQGNEKKTASFYESASRSVILGSFDFKEKLLAHLNDNHCPEVHSEFVYTKNIPSFFSILAAVANVYNLHPFWVLRSQRGVSNEARIIAIYLGRVLAMLSSKVLMRKFSVTHHGAIDHAFQRARRKLAAEQVFRDRLRSVLREVRVIEGKRRAMEGCVDGFHKLH